MDTTKAITISPALFLDGMTARELMTPNVMSISSTATLEAAVFLLMDKNLNAVPVVDEKGKAVGVLSRSDVVAQDFDQFQHLHQSADLEGTNLFPLNVGENVTDTGDRTVSRKGQQLYVDDVMTRVLYSVTPETPAKTVIDAMLTLGVHRLFVSDDGGQTLGVISSTDILRHLREPLTVTFEHVELLATDGQVELAACMGLDDRR